MQSRETLTKPILPAELAQPGFWAVFLPDLMASDDEYPEGTQRLKPDFSDGIGEGTRVISPELTLLLPHNYLLVLQFFESDVYFFLEGAGLPDDGLLGHNDCHCRLPILRWSEAERLAQVLQESNPTLPQGAAILLLWPTLWLNNLETQQTVPAILSALRILGLEHRTEFVGFFQTIHSGYVAPGVLPHVPFKWWELQSGDWVNNSPYSLRSVTTFEGARWDDSTRTKFNNILNSLGVNEHHPA